MRVVGIDPGVSGGLVGVDTVTERLDRVMPMPIWTAPNSKHKFVDGELVYWMLDEYKPDRIVIELVGSMPKQGVATTFQFGVAFGGVVSAAYASGVDDIVFVTPTVWKRSFDLIGRPKDVARRVCQNLWPEHAHTVFKLKKSSGIADAALIAVFGCTYQPTLRKAKKARNEPLGVASRNAERVKARNAERVIAA